MELVPDSGQVPGKYPSTMLRVISILLVSFALGSCQQQAWPHLRTTYGVPGISGFNPQPRTTSEAEDQGWIKLSSCGEESSWAGDRYIRSIRDKDMVLIFDDAGYIAGIQNIVPLESTLDDVYWDYTNSPYYVRGYLFNEEVYYATVYFVDPSIICNGGRTAEEFEVDGTGNIMAIQNGPTPSDYEVAPPLMAEAEENTKWYKHLCFINMGYHFFSYNTEGTSTCRDAVPYQLVYYYGKLNGIVFQHYAALDSDNFEQVNEFALENIVDTAPQCMVDATQTPGIFTMHVYVDTYIVTCRQQDEDEEKETKDRPRPVVLSGEAEY